VIDDAPPGSDPVGTVSEPSARSSSHSAFSSAERLSTGVPVFGGDTGHVEGDGVGELEAAGGVVPVDGGVTLPEAAGTVADSSGSGSRIPGESLGRGEGSEGEVPKPDGLVETCGSWSGAAVVAGAEGADRTESTAPRRPVGAKGRPNLRMSAVRTTTSTRV
jgi:hypothetical protein